MVRIMDMNTGKVIREPDVYDDQVLGANWLPGLEPALQLQEIDVTGTPARAVTDAETFLVAYYRSQE
jgi:hypothetical protein